MFADSDRPINRGAILFAVSEGDGEGGLAGQTRGDEAGVAWVINALPAWIMAIRVCFSCTICIVIYLGVRYKRTSCVTRL